MSLIVSGDGITFPDGVQMPSYPQGWRNRIINGAMVIDQRNAGASVTSANNAYSVDRWLIRCSPAAKFTAQQSTTAPAGFKNSLCITSTSSYSVAAGEYQWISQVIEGVNIADLGWGTADAQPITVSFRVRSSLTGTFGAAIHNSSTNYSYPFTYAINAANTWETKTVTISGPTSGTWATDNGAGLYLNFGLGIGSNFTGAAGSWAAADYRGATGATSVVGTNGATFYITGVQLERGSVATPFDYVEFGESLRRCQRYCQLAGASFAAFRQGSNYLAGQAVPLQVAMRDVPTWSNFPTTWVTAAPSAGQMAGYDYTAAAQTTVSGAITVYEAANTANTWRPYIQAGTSFSGTAGSTVMLGVGSAPILTAEL